MDKFMCIGVCSIILILIAANLTFADGFIIPIPPPHVAKVPPLALKYHHVSVEIDEQVARTTIDQVFINDFHRDLEGTYIFPIPKGAQITEFAMYIDGERISGELLEKEKARRIYQDIVNRMKDPALLEYLDRDMFKIRVYPIPAHGEKRIQLEYSEVLTNDAEVVRYHYPLDTERFSSRPLNEVSVDVTIRSQNALKSIYSPSHDVVVERKNDHHAVVSYEDTQIVPEKDFILYYTLSEKDFGANLLTYKKSRQDGFFMLMLSPGYALTHQRILPKDIVFVLDTSGSMRRDKKLQQAQEALIYGLEGLNAEDRFGIVTFSTSIETFDDVLLRGESQNIDDAVRFVKQLRARGGTDIYEALQTALALIRESERASSSKRPKFVVFLTDGRPTVGVTEYTDILQKVRKKNADQVRLFTFGVGYDVNTHLLDDLAGQSHAASAYIEPFEDLEVLVSSFFDKIDSPVLSDLELRISGAGVYDVYPKDLPDLFKGSQLLLFGRYRTPGKFQLVLSGQTDDKEKVYTYDIDFPYSARRHDFLPRIWASRKIGYLLDQIRLHGEESELKEEVIELAKKYGIVTPYTSYLVTEDEEIEAHREGRRPRPLFRELFKKSETTTSRTPTGDQNVASEMYKLGSGETPALAPGFTETKEGEVAVRVSKDVEKLKQQSVATEAVSKEIRYLGTKTFYRIHEVWTDSEYPKGQETLKIVFGSDAYFQLLDAVPEIGKFLSLGEQLIVCLDEDLCLNIGTQGITDVDAPALLNLLQKLQ